jgi:C1A family cysteine protease
VRNLGAPGTDITDQQLSVQGCGTAVVTDPDCFNVLLLVLTPASYSSNNTKDTPGRLAFISPAQDQGKCSACVGFAATAAAEAAVNVYKQQSWAKSSLSEQDLSFCR